MADQDLFAIDYASSPNWVSLASGGSGGADITVKAEMASNITAFVGAFAVAVGMLIEVACSMGCTGGGEALGALRLMP